MAAKLVLLKELIEDLKKELEEYHVNFSENNVELQQKFRQARVEESNDP